MFIYIIIFAALLLTLTLQINRVDYQVFEIDYKIKTLIEKFTKSSSDQRVFESVSSNWHYPFYSEPL